MGSGNISYTSTLSLLGSIPTTGTLLTGGLSSTVPAPLPHQWFYLVRRFQALFQDMMVPDPVIDDGTTKQAGVRACLNRYYWDVNSKTNNSLLVGSWGKRTRVNPSHDIDIMFLLPSSVYFRFEERAGNKQSQLLQEVRNVLSATYPKTEIRGDGQVVSVPFNTIPIEVVPAFRCQDGNLIICDTKDNGRYKAAAPEAELQALDAADTAYNKSGRALTRMLKKWQDNCNVPIKAFQLERLAIDFLSAWPHNQEGMFYYDWMVRDFLAYLIGRRNGSIIMPGTRHVIALGEQWYSKALSAYLEACAACEAEKGNKNGLAGAAWQKIFGKAIPAWVS